MSAGNWSVAAAHQRPHLPALPQFVVSEFEEYLDCGRIEACLKRTLAGRYEVEQDEW